MATFPGMSEMLLPGVSRASAISPVVNSTFVLDAAAKALHYVGQLWLNGGETKTISSAGGKIHWRTNSVTFIGSTLRVGIQDVSDTIGPPVRGDGTFDVSSDIVTPDTIPANSWQITSMETGSKTIAHNALLAVVFNITAFTTGDTVGLSALGSSGTLARPSTTLETGGTFSSQAAIPNVSIEFDDGTLGFLRGGFVFSAPPALTTYSMTSTPDEIGNIIILAESIEVDGFYAIIGTTANSNNYDMVLYSNPLAATPVALRTVSVDANQRSGLSARGGVSTFDKLTLAAGTYAITVRPTTTGTITLEQFSVNASGHMNAHHMGTSCYRCSRSDQAGAFSTDSLSRAAISLIVSGLESGISETILARGANTLLRM